MARDDVFGGGFAEPVRLAIGGIARVSRVADEVAGLEADLVFNPTPRWRILMNVAKQETVQSNSLPFMKRFVALMKPVWDKLASTPRGNYPTGYVPGAPIIS